jgi:hypothetical protein
MGWDGMGWDGMGDGTGSMTKLASRSLSLALPLLMSLSSSLRA